MPDPRIGVFLPGWGASAALYTPGLPAGWHSLDPPRFDRRAGWIDRSREWLAGELDRLGAPGVLAGHSMGAALAMAAAASAPERVGRLVLVSPAGLPLAKPIGRSVAEFGAQVLCRRYPSRTILSSIRRVGVAPRAALAVARAVRGLDLSEEMLRLRSAGIRATVVGCSTDSLVTVAHCRRIAELLGATYRQLDLAGGHMWMLRRWDLLAHELSR
jgi:pimeloyl-ACP methyl ester carboxylesterase